jgi:hypothetical protein
MSSIVLVGDEFLDNKHHLEVPGEDLQYELEQLGHSVENFATKKQKLKELTKVKLPKASCYVLSIGTEDFRGNILTILNVEKFVKNVMSEEYKTKFVSYVCDLTEKGKVIFLIAPKPYMGSGSTYKKYSSTIEYIISAWIAFVRDVGKKHGVILIDSTALFDSTCRGLYGNDECHGSHVMSKVVAHCISDAQKQKGYGRYTSVKKSWFKQFLFDGVTMD